MKKELENRRFSKILEFSKFNCGHMCCCITCTKDLLLEENTSTEPVPSDFEILNYSLKKENCLLCREEITSIKKIYF